MDSFVLLMNGLQNALQPQYIGWAVFGGILGIIVGALPGMGSSSGCALLLPLTYKLDPTAAIIMLGALYFGNMFGGAISAILINIPGDSPAVMTALDGYKMTKKGQAGKALFTAFFASFFGGLIGALLLTFLGKVLTNIGLAFGPAEMTLLIMFAMTSIAWALGESPIKGLISTCIGLAVALIGVDIITGYKRMTFGMVNLLGGLEFIPVVIGLFGMSQVIKTIVEMDREQASFEAKIKLKDCLLEKKEMLRCTIASMRSAVIGFFIGVLPGSGATLGALLSYLAAKRIEKRDIGSGVPEGIASVEAANNAASIGSFAPLLALGIPGSGTSAILLGGLMMWGLQPGPLFMTQQAKLAWSMIGSMYISDIMIAIICMLALPFLIYILKVSTKILAPIIIAVCIVGAYSAGNNVFNVYVMFVMGILGYFLNRYNYPLAPLTLAIVLAPKFETSMRQAFLISGGRISGFAKSGVSITLLVLIALFILAPVCVNLVGKSVKKSKKQV